MKKTLLTIAITLGLAMGATAQSDSFFNDWTDFDNRFDDSQAMPLLPDHGLNGNADAPLGTGLLVLTALGAGYAVAKRRGER